MTSGSTVSHVISTQSAGVNLTTITLKVPNKKVHFV